MEYINYYHYSEDEEKIVIIHSPYDEEAKAAYIKAQRVPGNSWYLDVAIDCVRQMSEIDRDYVIHHMWTSDYHFGYAMRESFERFKKVVWLKLFSLKRIERYGKYLTEYDAREEYCVLR